MTISNFGLQITSSAGRLGSVTADQRKLVARLNRVVVNASRDRSAEFRGGGGIAASATGTIYIDANAGMFSPVGGIIAVSPNGHITPLWLSRITKP